MGGYYGFTCCYKRYIRILITYLLNWLLIGLLLLLWLWFWKTIWGNYSLFLWRLLCCLLVLLLLCRQSIGFRLYWNISRLRLRCWYLLLLLLLLDLSCLIRLRLLLRLWDIYDVRNFLSWLASAIRHLRWHSLCLLLCNTLLDLLYRIEYLFGALMRRNEVLLRSERMMFHLFSTLTGRVCLCFLNEGSWLLCRNLIKFGTFLLLSPQFLFSLIFNWIFLLLLEFLLPPGLFFFLLLSLFNVAPLFFSL